MSNIQSKLKGSFYRHCPLCEVSTHIDYTIGGLEHQLEQAHKIISERNDIIDGLQKEMKSLKEDLSVARGSLYEVVDQRNRALTEIRKQVFGSKTVFDREIVEMANNAAPAPAPPPQTFMLNETHTTHITKSQHRKEMREARKKRKR